MLQQQCYAAMYFIFIWIAQSIDSYDETHSYAHREHMACVETPMQLPTRRRQWRKRRRNGKTFKEGSHDNFRSISLHPHMTCIWISIKKRGEHTIHTCVRPNVRIQPKIVLLFYAHRFPFFCYRSTLRFLHPLAPHFSVPSNIPNGFIERNFASLRTCLCCKHCVCNAFSLWCDTTM